MKFRISSFATKLTLIVVVLLTGLTTVLFVGLFSTWGRFEAERYQLQYHGLAAQLARSVEPFLTPVLDGERFLHEANTMQQLLPTADVYLLTAKGEVVLRLCGDVCAPATEPVPVAAIEQRLNDDGRSGRLIAGPDPGAPGKTAPFSVARVVARGQPHYLYIVLRNGLSRRLYAILQESAAIRTSVLLAVGASVVFSVVGIWLVRRTSARFYALIGTVHEFEGGDLARRASETGDDELADLGRAFNRMASTLADTIDRLRDRDEKRRELIANIWHDIRRPVSGVSLLAETLQHSSSLSNEDRLRLSNSVVANVSLLNTLLADLGELGRLETGEIVPAKERCDPAELVYDIELAFRPLAEKQHKTLQCSVAGDLPEVVLDPAMISRVLANLVDNALRHTASGGSIVISLRPAADGIFVAVRDSGSGIAAKDLPHIFERHYRGASVPGAVHEQAGLGLAIATKMLECHDSCLEVESQPGVGTEFRFCLRSPVAQH